MNNLILSAETILPVASDPLTNSAVAISDGKILGIDKLVVLTKKYNNFKHIKLGKGLLMPGFINGHIHLELGWIQSHIGNFSNFTEWLSQIITAKRTHNITKRTLDNSVRSGISSLINCGVTTVGEISSFGGADIPHLKKSGLRSIIFEELFDKDTESIKNKSYQSDGLLETRPFPHAPYSCSPRLLKEVYKLARKSDLPTGIHLAESPEETDFIRQKKNSFETKIFPLIEKSNFKRPEAKNAVQYFSNFNKGFNTKSTIIHAVQLNKEDINLLRKKPIGIVLCPRSNMFLKVGVPPLKHLVKLKRLGLGTDGLSSNYNLDFFEEMKALHLLLSGFMGKEASFQTVYCATLGGARSLFIEEKTGSIEVGKEADMIFLSYNGKSSDPYLQVLLSDKDNVQMNMVSGQIIWSRNDKYKNLNG